MLRQSPRLDLVTQIDVTNPDAYAKEFAQKKAPDLSCLLVVAL